MSDTLTKRITAARDVMATPAEVWSVLAAFDAIADWAPNIDHSCLTTGQTSGVGTARRVQSGDVVVVERVATWEPELMLSYSIEGLPPALRSVSNTWILRPAEEGASISLITDIATERSPLGFVAGHAVRRRLAAASEQMLAGLADRTQEST